MPRCNALLFRQCVFHVLKMTKTGFLIRAEMDCVSLPNNSMGLPGRSCCVPIPRWLLLIFTDWMGKVSETLFRVILRGCLLRLGGRTGVTNIRLLFNGIAFALFRNYQRGFVAGSRRKLPFVQSVHSQP